MANVQETVHQLRDLNERYNGDDIILATNMMLAYPRYTSSSRMIMIGNQLRQYLVLCPKDESTRQATEKPRVFTNYENVIGEYSDYNIRAESDYEVTNIIKKFSKFDTDAQPYLMFLRDKNTGEYSVFERKDVEDLPEKYGFQYDNSGIDKFQIGDTIPQGEPLMRPTSFDPYGNWGYGKNVTFMYAIDDDTIEDAVKVSKSLSEELCSTEVETVRITLSENNFFLNMYGDDESYKCFPDVGETVKDGKLCVKRLIRKSQILFDMTNSNTRRKMSGDVAYYINGTVVDVDIYSNKKREEIPDTSFNKQVLEYLDMSTEYWTEVRDYTQKLIDSGAVVSTKIRSLNKRSKELLDPDTVIKDNKSTFSNIVMYIQVKRKLGLSLGQKVAGRHGNKGVISKIVPDHEMPHVVETGERVDIVFNTLGIIGRLNIFQMFEQAITFIMDQQLIKIKSCDSIKDKEYYLFRLLEIFNKEYHDWAVQDYRETCKTKKDKKEYFEILEKEGIYMHIPPYWSNDDYPYECIKRCYEEFPWIQPYTIAVYDDISEQWVPVINKQIIGSMYIMKLKQSSKKGFIARSTGTVSTFGVPCKSDNAKKHLLPFSQQPIRHGEQEYCNQLISIPAEMIAKKAVFSRTSPIGRMELGKQLFQYPLGIDDIDVAGNMTNRIVDLLNCHLLLMGRSAVFEYDVLNLDESNPNAIKEHLFQNELYYCTTEEIKKVVARKYGKLKIENSDEGYILLGDEADLEEFLDEIVELTYEDITDELEYNGGQIL